MKKRIIVIMLIMMSMMMVACSQSNQISYTDDEPILINLDQASLKVLQLTDLHLTYGIDAYDQKTFDLITKLIQSDDFDLVVISGDMTLSTGGPRLFKQLVKVMEENKTPWTFVFGNHETDYHDYQDYLRYVQDTEYLYFKVGPNLEDGGVGNFVIRFMYEETPFYDVILMDSHAEREVYTEEEGEYDYIKPSQVEWYKEKVANTAPSNIVFMHMPLRQFIESEGYVGIFNEDKVYAQGVDTFLFDAFVENGKTKGLFVGHDHLNDFYLVKEDILLVYGRITGFSAYGNLERGGKAIEISEDGTITLRTILESGLSE